MTNSSNNSYKANLDGKTLDQIDLAIIKKLQENGRISNIDLAESLNIAPSTCLGRVKTLQQRGVINGFSANINPKSLGWNLQVLISVSIRSGARKHISEFAEEIKMLPEVLQLFFLGGVEDFIIHLVAEDSDHVRDFVVNHLSAHSAVASTRTSMMFEHYQNSVPIVP